MNNNKGANSCLALATLQAMFTTSANFTTIGLFKGAVPDLDAAVAALSSNNTITAANFMTALGATAENCLAVQRLPQMVPSYDPMMNVWRLGLSALTASMPAVASGTPTYAVIRQGSAVGSADTYAGALANSVNVLNALVLTVGSDTSDAELRILDGVVTSGQSYRFTDLQVNL